MRLVSRLQILDHSSIHAKDDPVTLFANFLHAAEGSAYVGDLPSSPCAFTLFSDHVEAFFSEVGLALTTCSVVFLSSTTANRHSDLYLCSSEGGAHESDAPESMTVVIFLHSLSSTPPV